MKNELPRFSGVLRIKIRNVTSEFKKLPNNTYLAWQFQKYHFLQRFSQEFIQKYIGYFTTLCCYLCFSYERRNMNLNISLALMPQHSSNIKPVKHVKLPNIKKLMVILYVEESKFNRTVIIFYKYTMMKQSVLI